MRLARYAPEEVSTDAKRIARFRKGLTAELKYALTQCKPALFSDFVDAAICQETTKADLDAERKRQREFTSAAMVHKKQKMWVPDPPPQRQQFHPRGAPVRSFTRPPVPVQQVPRSLPPRARPPVQ